jgi:hypothetical protein
MALQGPFFGKRDTDPTPTRPAGSPLGGTSSLGSAAAAQPFAAPVPAGASTSPLAAAPAASRCPTAAPS